MRRKKTVKAISNEVYLSMYGFSDILLKQITLGEH